MLDGFTVEPSDFYPAPKKSAKLKKSNLARSTLVLLASIALHLFIIAVLVFISPKPLPKQFKSTHKAIKSYLYKKPISQLTIEKPAAAQLAISQVEQIALAEKRVTIKKVSVKSAAIKPTPRVKKSDVNKADMPSMLDDKRLSQPPNEELTPKKISAYKQLGSLRHSINEKIMEDEINQIQQFRSASLMHGEEIAVPHSNKPLTAEQERQKNTKKLSNDMSITKLEDGWCMIEREQFLGSPIEGSRSVFACGESKFDKSFREHMERVRDKIMPVKKQGNKK